MEEILRNLSGIWYLATSENGQPHVRPFDKCALIDGNIYIGTDKNKRVFLQIVKNPMVEIYAMTDFGPCRFMAEAYADDEKTVEAFLKMGKITNENSIAIRLDNIKQY